MCRGRSTSILVVCLILVALSSFPAAADPDAASFCQKAVASHQQNDFNRMLTHANSAIRVSPNSAYGHYLRGEALMALKRFDEATLAFQSAHRLYPAEARYNDLMLECLKKQQEVLNSAKSAPPKERDGESPTISKAPSSEQTISANSRPRILSAATRLMNRLRVAFPNNAPMSSSDLDRFRAQNQNSLGTDELVKLEELKQEIERRKSEIAEDYGADIRALMTIAPGDEPISQSFIDGVTKELNTIPVNLRQTFRSEGYKVMLITDVSKAMNTKLMNQHPRGYPEGATYTQVPAYCDHRAKRLVIVQSLQGKQRSSPSDSLGHEFGHAFDIILGRKVIQDADENAKLYPRMSHSPLYRDAYNADLQHFPEQYRATLAYYLQSDEAGQEELFAEMFPILYGRQHNQNTMRGNRLELLRASFPSVLQVMRTGFNIYD